MYNGRGTRRCAGQRRCVPLEDRSCAKKPRAVLGIESGCFLTNASEPIYVIQTLLLEYMDFADCLFASIEGTIVSSCIFAPRSVGGQKGRRGKVIYESAPSTPNRSLTHDRLTKNVTKKCGCLIVGFFSYFTNLLRAKSDLLGLSSYIDFSISHVNSHLRNWPVFGFFAFIWTHLRRLARTKYSKYGFRRKMLR